MNRITLASNTMEPTRNAYAGALLGRSPLNTATNGGYKDPKLPVPEGQTDGAVRPYDFSEKKEAGK